MCCPLKCDDVWVNHGLTGVISLCECGSYSVLKHQYEINQEANKHITLLSDLHSLDVTVCVELLIKPEGITC